MSELSELRKQLIKRELEKLFFDNGIVIYGYDIEITSYKFFENDNAFRKAASESAEKLASGAYYDSK